MEFVDMLNMLIEQVRNDLDFTSFLTGLRNNNIIYYIHFISTGNVRFITTTDAIISIKSKRKIILINSGSNIKKIKNIARLHFSGKLNYEQYCTALADAGVFKWSVDLAEERRDYWSKDNILLHTEKVMLNIK
ncbi:DUF1398 domain-containing protein [Escherichia coli]|uniref:DUF1398 family protein n=1 Tax=Escherichia coli TaxID=562 RepID=UPI001354EABC|nr:DUF1398 family protein [Escherichia coli]EHH6606153.1 DUF1398 domain-containing protein [Escherichia coli]MWM71879.1 DUF1398 domain-containing protein [Escherichia coli]HAH9783539.1 DUF1398 domain-containing protein [Escherichia coli]HAW1411504.1 DUF1398 domain-containing protein [Escherichia coli]HAW2909079.1 DUF1398 domain-containing protein [Escherichia coli]